MRNYTTTAEFIELSARADVLHIFTRALASLLAVPFCLLCRLLCAVRRFVRRPARAILADIFRGLSYCFSVAEFVVIIIKCMIY